MARLKSESVKILAGEVTLEGDLSVPEGSMGIVLFAHGSGSSRFSPRNRAVARVLEDGGLATLLFDLLTEKEEAQDVQTREFRFDIELLAERLNYATDWVMKYATTRNLMVGYFGASTGAAAALIAAAGRADAVYAVVSRGGRTDLAKWVLPQVKAPTLFIVGENDPFIIEVNRQSLEQLNAKKELVIVSGASHLFEEPGALEEVAQLAANWFKGCLKR